MPGGQDSGQPPPHEMDQLPPPYVDPATISAQDLLQHIKALLAGQDLTSISMGSLRQRLAQRLGLQARALDSRRQELITLTQDAVQQISEDDAQVDVPDWATPVDDTARLMVYLVTLSSILQDTPAPDDMPFRDPSDLSKEEVRDAILDAVANPIHDAARGGRPRSRQVEVAKLVGCKEPHTSREDKHHHHVALRMTVQTPFLPMKKALRQRHGLASHWSTSHSMLWSAVRYICFPTENKLIVDPCPLTWTPDGRALNLYEESQQPFCADVVKKRREVAAMQPLQAAKKTKSATGNDKFGKMDLTSLILAEGLQTPAQVMAYVQDKGSVAMQAYVNKHQRRLRESIEDAHAWDAARRTAEEEKESDWDLVVRLSQGTCSCGEGGCQWWAAAVDFFTRNRPRPGVPGVDRQLLAASLRSVMQRGPSKTARVPLLVGPSNTGKSTLVDPVREVFGPEKVFNKPKLGAPCPLSKLPHGKRFIYFDDFRPVEYAALPRDNPTLSTTTFLALFQGQPFDVQVSQSFNDGHPEVVWRRGAAMTAKDVGLWQPMGMVSTEDVRHMQSRVIQFTASHVLRTAAFVDVPACKESWARWVVADSMAYAARPAPRAPPRLRGRELPSLPISEDA